MSDEGGEPGSDDRYAEVLKVMDDSNPKTMELYKELGAELAGAYEGAIQDFVYLM